MGSSNSLPSFGTDPGYTTLSAWSGGAGFATNLHVSHSDTIKGVGLVNGGTYAIGEYRDIGGIFQQDMVGSDLSSKSIEIAGNYEAEGKVDPLSNLNGQGVVIFSSGMDAVMLKPMQDGQKLFYENYGANIEYRYHPTFEHGWPVDIPTDIVPYKDCSIFNYPSQNCALDTPGIILEHTLTNIPNSKITALNPKNNDWMDKGVFKAFDQTEFIEKDFFEYSGLDDTGYYFVPNQCLEDGSNCMLHVHTHGCGNAYRQAGLKQFTTQGIHEWAITNDIIVLHPQAATGVRNLFGCFDMGLGVIPRDTPNRKDFTNKEGIQIKAVKNMIDRILAPRDAAAFDYTSDGNILPVDGGRPAFIQFFYQAFNTAFYIAGPWFIKWFPLIYIWYPYYSEHFGACHLCIFTLLGFVDKVDPWSERTTNL